MRDATIPIGAASLLLLLAGGCGRSGPLTIPVTGEVRQSGRPITGAEIAFYPTGGRPANGMTDAAGQFVLRTWKPADGAVQGEHVVCVVKQVVVKPADDKDPYGETRHALPERYASPATSPLRATVVPGRDNRFEFDLDAK